MILLIDNYDSFTYNLVQYVEELGSRCKVVRNDAITIDGIRRLRPSKLILSPGPGHPGEAGVTLEVIRQLSGEIPILGVCLGHQAIGQAFGGKVVRAKRQLHGKLSEIYHDGKGLYRGMPRPFLATRYHSLVIERRSLPSCLRITCETDDGTIMGVKHRRFAVEGVQFHPESIMTQDGKRLIAHFLEGRS